MSAIVASFHTGFLHSIVQPLHVGNIGSQLRNISSRISSLVFCIFAMALLPIARTFYLYFGNRSIQNLSTPPHLSIPPQQRESDENRSQVLTTTNQNQDDLLLQGDPDQIVQFYDLYANIMEYLDSVELQNVSHVNKKLSLSVFHHVQKFSRHFHGFEASFFSHLGNLYIRNALILRNQLNLDNYIIMRSIQRISTLPLLYNRNPISIDLSHAKITDEDLGKLITYYPNIYKLNLSRTKVTDAAFSILEELNSLKIVSFYGCSHMSTQAYRKFMEENPQIKDHLTRYNVEDRFKLFKSENFVFRILNNPYIDDHTIRLVRELDIIGPKNVKKQLDKLENDLFLALSSR